MKRSINFCGQYFIHSNRLHHVVTRRSQNTNSQHALNRSNNYLYPFVPCLMMISSAAGGGTREATYYHHLPITTHRCLFSSVKKNTSDLPPRPGGRRVWKAHRHHDKEHIIIDHTGDASQTKSNNCDDAGVDHISVKNEFWCKAVDEAHDCQESLLRICEQERQGGRMKQSQLGVLRDDPHDDIRVLIENYTASALASALREREDTLQHCATLLANNQLDELATILKSYEQRNIIQRRHRNKEKTLDFTQGGFDNHDIELLRKGLNRMPRRVSTAHSKRAGVVLPLCNVDGVPCILFEKRSSHLRAHPDEVCLPGGMVSVGGDRSIVQTCLREMEEEIGIGHNAATVLGVLRCNWGEVHHLVGVAVTPVVCFLGEIGESHLNPNPSEVAEVFTVPLELFLDRDRWIHKQNYAPFFTGGPHIIWGLTAYIVNRFVKDIVERYDVVFEDHTDITQ